MNPTRKILFGSLLLVCLPFGLSSCYTDGYVATGVYYGPQHDPWFRDDPWMDYRPWYHEPREGANIGIYIHPPRYPQQRKNKR